MLDTDNYNRTATHSVGNNVMLMYDQFASADNTTRTPNVWEVCEVINSVLEVYARTAENSAKLICVDFGVTGNLFRPISAHPFNPTGVSVPDSAGTKRLEKKPSRAYRLLNLVLRSVALGTPILGRPFSGRAARARNSRGHK